MICGKFVEIDANHQSLSNQHTKYAGERARTAFERRNPRLNEGEMNDRAIK